MLHMSNDHYYDEHDILGSLIVAKDYIKGDVVIIYSDILFDAKLLRTNNSTRM